MKRVSLTLILVGSILLLSAGSALSNPSGKQNKRATANEPESTEQRRQEPLVPVSLLQASQSALNEALSAIRAQEEAAGKYNSPKKDNWDKAVVIADYLLFLVGCLYTLFALGQWSSIAKQVLIANDALDIARAAQRAQVILGRMDGKLMELIPPRVGEPLKIKMFFLNSGDVAADQFFVRTMVSYGGKPASMIKGHTIEPEPWRTREPKFGGSVGPSSAPIGAGAIRIEIAASRDILTEQDIDNLYCSHPITVSGKFQYFDGFGQPEFRAFSAYYLAAVQEFLSNNIPFIAPSSLDRRKPGFGMNTHAEPEGTTDHQV
jgi:hypothetical protein